MSEFTKTLCPYCGVGCGLEVSPPAQHGKATNRDSQGTPIWRVRGDKAHPSSQGMVCVKGATIAESLDKSRLQYPMIRDSLDQDFRRASWEEAFDLIVQRIQTVRFTQGPEAICMYGSGQFQTEDYYIAQKLMKGCLGSNNFDANSRLCMSSAVAGYIQSFGSDGPPCCYEDLELTDCAFLIGTNTAECHPIIFNRLEKYRKKNRKVKLIVVDPRRTPTAENADLHLAIRPGTDIDLLNGIAHLLMRWNQIDVGFIDDCTSNFPAYAEVIRHYSPDVVAHRCGISVADLETAARYWGQSQRVLSLWSMGINQSSEGTAKVRTIINLHLMTGQIGKPGSGPFSLTGQPNAMGGREAGGLSHLLPGYRLVKNPQHRAEVENFWGLKPGQISPEPGMTAWDMITGLENGAVGLLWIAATNPAVSMPDLERTKKALLRSPFTIYQDAYYPTETSAYAHVLLPAAQWSEKTGVMTNSERRVTLCSAFRFPWWEAKADWEIFAEVGRRLGFTKEFAFANSTEVYAEFVQLTRDRPCDMTGMSHELLQTQGPTQWPCPEISTGEDEGDKGDEGAKIQLHPRHLPDSKRLYTDLRFHTPDGRARFGAYHSRGLAEPPDPNYPFVLTTGRLYGHWHTQTRTGRIEKIRAMHPEPFIEIHPRDAAALGITDHQWLEVRSRRGKAKFPAKITKAIAPGTVFVPMHWGALWADEAEANALTHPESCPDSLQPELKACAVDLTPISAEITLKNYQLQSSQW
ncbi:MULTISPECIES: molybdopterin oxidoreductase family protein [unclassified Tolypothrix]|uniref:molybdopterin oxidoreductase family protein n=1 Tax=unclassified Tolypothrix TaxID=2649714 RepID=UPI0005EAAA91|nr:MULTISPECIES: nitrate reductase [unclassified Tolypothrix]BAY93589.1 molybdopterin oxidoreductase NarB [Microchaete diplosiphon NIES-3275]EKE99623.1 molybdopterin oxidoreductase [Tolypothrix sp. PCC 7601]MBE9082412.1 nitrate reductase [Tolypothrix sp. LEGE 11397]UYD27416.1 nitrate reductase [Tolypothrix sp. PCC 7712]UYD36719.1 nitrate reductase [Tolypothrix sp. PCC 7601]